jgi:hypothetical protein
MKPSIGIARRQNLRSEKPTSSSTANTVNSKVEKNGEEQFSPFSFTKSLFFLHLVVFMPKGIFWELLWF